MPIITTLINTILFSFLEPLVYFSFSVSIYLIYISLLKSLNIKTIVTIIVAGLILDITLKYNLGSHILVSSVLLLFFSLLSKFIPDNIKIYEIVKLLITFLLSLSLLKFLQNPTFTFEYLTSSIFPSIYSTIVSIIISFVLVQIGSNNELNRLKLK